MYIVTYVFMIFTYLRSYIFQNFVLLVWVGCACVIIIIIVFIQNLNNRRQQQTGQFCAVKDMSHVKIKIKETENQSENGKSTWKFIEDSTFAARKVDTLNNIKEVAL